MTRPGPGLVEDGDGSGGGGGDGSGGGDGGSHGATHLLLTLDPRTLVSLTVALLATFAVFAVVRDTSGMLTRLGIGVVLALALDGVVQRIRQRFGIRRSVAVGAVALALLALAATVVLALGPPAIEQARAFATNLPQTVRDLYEVPVVGGWLERADAASTIEQWVADLPANLSTDRVADVAESVLGGIVTTVVVLVTTFSVLLDGERLVALFRHALPARTREHADRAGRVFYRVVGRYFGGSLTVAALMGVYVLALALVFGVPLAPLAAVWAMVTNLIPQVGGLLAGGLLGILALAAGPGTAVVVVGLFVLYMSAENHLIQPAVVGTAVNLSPPTTMLAALVGGAAAGVPGALVATPVVGAAKQLYLEFQAPGRDSDDPPGPRSGDRPTRPRRWPRSRRDRHPG